MVFLLLDYSCILVDMDSAENIRIQKDLAFAAETARKAGDILLRYFGTDVTRSIKTHKDDFATEADVESEEFIIAEIKRNYPSDGIVAEESGEQGSVTAEHTWIIDPLDGTYNFANGNENFGVMIGRMRGDQHALAAIYVPTKDILVTAFKGQGVFRNSERIQLDSTSCTNKTVAAELHKDAVEQAGYQVVTRVAVETITDVLRGHTIGCCWKDGKVWDRAIPAVILEEAGLTVTTMSGKPYVWNGEDQSMVSGLGSVHADLVSAMSE